MPASLPVNVASSTILSATRARIRAGTERARSYRVRNREAVSIGPQETAYFDSQVGHIYLSESDDGADAHVMVVMTDR